MNLHKPVIEQPQYNALARQNFEKDQRRIFSEYGYGSTIWSPLASGILAGKYNSGEIPDGSRFSTNPDLMFIFKRFFNDKEKDVTIKKLNDLADYAKSIGYSQAQLCLAWAIANKDVSTCLLGFTREEQIHENMKALELYKKWNDEHEKKVREILSNDPEGDMDWRIWSN